MPQPTAQGAARRTRWARYRVTRPFSPRDLAALCGVITGIVALALVLGWALELRGGKVIVLAIPFVSLWFDARRVLFQFDADGVRVGRALLPWTDVTRLVVAMPPYGEHVLLGADLRPGATVPADADLPAPGPAMPAPLHVAVERRKFDLDKMAAKARKHAPPHIEIVVTGPDDERATPTRPPLTPPPHPAYAPPPSTPHPAYTPRPTPHPAYAPRPTPHPAYAPPPTPHPAYAPPPTPHPAYAHPVYPPPPPRPTHEVRWGAMIGIVLTCAAVLALFVCAMPLMAYQFDVDTGDGQPYHGNESAYRALGLDEFPGLSTPPGVLSWPWLLAPLLAQAAPLYLAALPQRPRTLARILGFLCALALPLRLLADDVWWEPVVMGLPAGSAASLTVSFEGGWWLLHAGALLGLVAFVWQDIAADRNEPKRPAST
ncbi:hypothetical protein ACX6XY_06930 [Streptomyces sp. O3]